MSAPRSRITSVEEDEKLAPLQLQPGGDHESHQSDDAGRGENSTN